MSALSKCTQRIFCFIWKNSFFSQNSTGGQMMAKRQASLCCTRQLPNLRLEYPIFPILFQVIIRMWTKNTIIILEIGKSIKIRYICIHSIDGNFLFSSLCFTFIVSTPSVLVRVKNLGSRFTELRTCLLVYHKSFYAIIFAASTHSYWA